MFQKTPHSTNATPPGNILPVLKAIKDTYILWHTLHTSLPKTHKYTLGHKIDTLFVELIESVATATFLKQHEKLSYIKRSIQKLDTIKIMLMILWETKSIDDKKYINLSMPLNEIGKMLGGWNGQVTKQNSPQK